MEAAIAVIVLSVALMLERAPAVREPVRVRSLRRR